MAETVSPSVSILHCPDCDSDLWVLSHRILTVKGHQAADLSVSQAHSCLRCGYLYDHRLPINDDGWQSRPQPIVPPEDDGA